MMMTADKIGPCPIHRCALEYFLAVLSIATGFGFVFLPIGLQLRKWLTDLPPVAGHLVQPTWGVVLVFVGVVQAVAVWRHHSSQRFQKWAAVAAAIAWLIVGVTVVHAGLFLLTPSFVIVVGAEIYVAGMLKP